MGRTLANLSAVLVATMAFLWGIGASAGTAQADPRGDTNIPEAAPENVAAPAGELPLPYESWHGTGALPPTPAHEREAPLPLARARELPRRTLELTAAFTALLPSCTAGSIDDRSCMTVRAGGGVDIAALYRVSPFFGVGLEGVMGGLSGDSTRTRFGGVVGRLYFADSGVWDPYLALTIGVGTLALPNRGGDDATTGLGGRVAGGIDYLLGPHLRLGPTASFAHWIVWNEERCESGTCRDRAASYGRLLGFATLGVRISGSFGEVL
jgi:hypothetical protein